jgi:hypothetical protein
MSAKNFILNLTLLAATILPLAGCDAIYDEDGDCSATYLVRFRYDMNMKYADAFYNEVNAVTLYVLDDDNNIVWKGHESGYPLTQEGYTMTLPINPGKYKLLAWCSSNKINTWTMTTDDSPIQPNSKTDTPLDNLGCVLNTPATFSGRSSKSEADDDLDALYHGLITEAEFPDKAGTYVVTMPLTKDTNRIRVVMQHSSGTPLDVNQFDFSITADNALLLWDNTVEPGHQVVYQPWNTSSAASDHVESDASGAYASSSEVEDNVVNVAIAEMTMSRLVVDDNPRLTVINKEDGSIVFSIPILDYFLMVKGYENSDMPDQEYLDRQDEYNMTFFLDEGNRWMDSFIYINSWKVILQNNKL